jgi:AcrR family transcriptional regulator
MAELLRIARSEFVRKGYRQTTMASIAVAAGLTKRTLYQWHADKAALFRACIMENAARFPTLDSDEAAPPRTVLYRYLAALIREFTAEDSSAIGRLFVRESGDFPELAPIIQRSYDEYVLTPLSRYLCRHDLEERGSTERTELLLAMALAQVHDSLLLGRAMPGPRAADSHAQFVTDFFLGRTAETTVEKY